MKRYWIIFFIALFSVAFGNLRETLDALSMYQGGDGGMVEDQLKSSAQLSAKGNIESTKSGIFLASLFNHVDKITLSGLGEFIKEHSRKDGGFSENEESSDIISTRNILLIYHFLGIKIQNPQEILGFVRSLLDDRTGLYSRSVGEPGSLEATCAAFQVFTLLGSLKAPFVTNTYPRLHSILQDALDVQEEEAFFNFPNVSPITSNSYAVYLAVITDFDLAENVEKLVNFFVSRQRPSGGFSSNNDNGNHRNTQEATYALSLLSSVAKFDYVSTKINLEALENFINSAGPKLSDVSYAQQTSIAAGLINNLFKANLVLENENGEEINGGLTVGTRFRPTITVTSFDNSNSNRFQVELNTIFGKDTEKFQLVYSKERTRYMSSEIFDTGKNLGTIRFSAAVRFQVATVGVIVLDFNQARTVGYRVNINSKAHQESTGKDISVGETVSVGTEFTFEVSLERENNERSSDSFEAQMNVVDSSGATIQSERGSSDSDSILFRYSLDKLNIPSGSLTFNFEISNSEVGSHSRGEVVYQLTSTMVASEISFVGSRQPVFKIGERVEVTMVPASFPDLRTIQLLDQTDFNGNNITREIFMDVIAAGTPIHSIRGQKINNAYLFSLSLVPRLDNFGSNTLSFRYVTVSGESIDLKPFDTENNELYEDLSQLSFSVPSDLRLFEVVEYPKNNHLSYGNSVDFRFKLRDNNSGQIIKSGSSGSTVYLSLIHRDESSGNLFTSVTKSASQSGEFFEIDWAITPNAVSGPAEIQLYAQGINSQRLDILDENGQSVSIKVEIGGKIDVTKHTYSSSYHEADKTTVVAAFSLSCQDVPLRDALLYASFLRSDGSVVVQNVHVASFEDSYQVSLTFPHTELPEGSYKFNFFRDISRSTNQQNQNTNEQPLFEISFDHQGSLPSSLPFSPQLVISTLIIAGFVAIFLKRNKILESTYNTN